MLLGIAATINVMAVDYTAKAKITVESSTGYSCIVRLSEAAEYGALNGNEMYMEGRKIALYALNGTTKLENARAASLDGVKLGLMTDNGTDYTFTITNVEGSNPLYLMDAQGENHELTQGASFTIYDLPANSTIEDRFTLGRPSAPTPVYVAQVTTNDYGWASFSYNANLVAIENDLKIYKGALAGNVLDLTQMDYIAADEGVIVYGTPSTTYHFAAGSGSADFSDNDLKPSSAWTSNTGNIFVLHDEALYLYTGSDMPANKAYLDLGTAPAPRRITFRFNGEQGIEETEMSVKAVKFIENGQIFIKRGEAIYNIQGQIVK